MKTVLLILAALLGGRFVGLWLGYKGKGLESMVWGKLVGLLVLVAALGLFLWKQGMVPGMLVLVLPVLLLISAVSSILRLGHA